WVERLYPSRAFGAPGLLAGGVGGLSLWQAGRWRRLPTPGVKTGEVQAILEIPRPGKSPDLWVGTSSHGLLIESGGRWRRCGKADGFPGDDIYALHATGEAGGGSLWVGFRGLGLGRLHQGRWTFYGVKDGLPGPSVYAMADSAVPTGVRLWVATPGGGLGWLDVDRPGAVWHRLGRLTVPPLPADALMALAKDGRGRIYVTSTQGVVRITLPPGQEDRPSDWRIETFTRGDGLPSNDCISGAILADGEGRIWVGTARGLAVFDPRRELPPEPLPHLILEQVEVDGRSRRPGAGIGLGYRERHLHLA
ncbi:MAG: hypothetical protein KGI56_08860, partial [Acidobacteriota bacterium]|nr:hypothetical protein [Acidobacteriota bacterium]